MDWKNRLKNIQQQPEAAQGIIPKPVIREPSKPSKASIPLNATADCYLPSPRAWLTESDELRTSGAIQDLEVEIIKLTSDNLPLQRTLLERYCEQFDRHHIWKLWELWEERAAIMQFDGGLSREEAEREAAKRYHLTAFL